MSSLKRRVHRADDMGDDGAHAGVAGGASNSFLGLAADVLCRSAQLILFHHDPTRTDRRLAEIVEEAQAQFANTIAAKEGWSVTL